ncbi:MAG: ATP-dependent DNA helicase [Pseudomonadota bacterium]
MLDLSFYFNPDGPFAKTIPGYRIRSQQLEMAESVARAIEKRERLIVEAGTGTGKTFAYLVPALLAGGKVIISTGTKTLQDQLFNRDVPMVRAALKAPVTIALLKGRANYVCHYHLQRSAADGRFKSREEIKHLKFVERFAATSRSGDKAELSPVPENAAIWPHVTSTRENCLGQECPDYKECFVMKARKAAQEADVVVVNHHLFFADIMLRDEGMAELLPACNTVILDEAHQLPETATVFFGDSISTAQLVEIARDTRAEAMVAARDFQQLPEACTQLDTAARELRLLVKDDSGRLPIHVVQRLKDFNPVLDKLQQRLDEFLKLLETQAQRSEGLQNCFGRAVELKDKLQRWRDTSDTTLIRWVEVFSHSLQLQATPLSVAEPFRRQLDAQARAWIFTSATLSVKGDFHHYQKEMGLEEATTASWESPFDFANQALLYAPQGLPEPNSPSYTAAVVAAALPVIRASGGRAFFLFTSMRALEEARGLLTTALTEAGLEYPILVQGDKPRTELLDRFRELGNAILLGSQSFWEGVDVKGEALSLVIIDKLPFTPPDDPVLAARIEEINKRGGNAFMDYQLPRAVINLKQGAGRLIRDENDRGVLMMCDPRLLSRPYGRRIWQSLPPMKRTKELAEVEAFFSNEQNTNQIEAILDSSIDSV